VTRTLLLFPWRGPAAGSLALVLALGLPLLLSSLAASSTPRAGDFFEYDYNTYVDEGRDYYTGYSDRMRSHYRYTVDSVAGDAVEVTGTGSWHYEDSNGLILSGTPTYHPIFSISTRRYISGIDANLTSPASVWFWIPTNVTIGQVVYVLDEPLTVASLSATVWLGIVPRSAVLLEGSGAYTRDDEYGNFSATYSDRYYFDRETGFIIAEAYTEEDVNSIASFRFRAELSVTASSYPIPLDLLTFSLVYLGVPAVAVLTIAVMFRVRRGPSRLRLGSKDFPTEVRIRKASSPTDVANLVPDGSPFFGPFLPVFAERSVAEGDPVVLALADRRIVGMALYDRESGVGSLFASDDVVARVLSKRLRMDDFFADETIPGRMLRAREVDRFAILQLRNPTAVPYDPAAVRPMTANDLPDVVRIAEGVYQGRAGHFIRSSFEGGDLGFVAVSGPRVVGFGFATIVGTIARLHTLTVSADQRARGLGTEIMKARLSALAALGVERVLVEISKNNTASMRIATRVGFAAVGESVYYSRKPEAAPIALQRQT